MNLLETLLQLQLQHPVFLISCGLLLCPSEPTAASLFHVRVGIQIRIVWDFVVSRRYLLRVIGSTKTLRHSTLCGTDTPTFWVTQHEFYLVCKIAHLSIV